MDVHVHIVVQRECWRLSQQPADRQFHLTPLGWITLYGDYQSIPMPLRLKP